MLPVAQMLLMSSSVEVVSSRIQTAKGKHRSSSQVVHQKRAWPSSNDPTCPRKSDQIMANGSWRYDPLRALEFQKELSDLPDRTLFNHQRETYIMF